MQNLGVTRSAYRRDHLLQTPDAFIRAPLPGMRGATAIIHAGPANGALFCEYTAEFEPHGVLGPASGQRFLFLLDGSLMVEWNEQSHRLEAGSFAYLPADLPHTAVASAPACALTIEKPYQPLPGIDQPAPFVNHEAMVASQPLMGDPSLQVQVLLPEAAAHDFAINIMTFEPGASLSLTEMHVMEHGLLMLAGGGIYRLSDCWYPVAAGDFIWMAPFCPQWFGALGKIPAKYLIYKDWNRHPLAAL